MTALSTRETATPKAPQRARRRDRTGKLVYGTIAVVVVVAAWQIVAALRIKPEVILPGPLDVADAFRQLFSTSEIWTDLGTSGSEMLFGLVLATLVGLPAGLLIGWYRRLSWALGPFEIGRAHV